MSSASGVGGLYNRDTNTIYVSSALSTDEAVDFVLKHEITHSIETTQAWSKMESLARQTMGEEAYAAAVREVMAQRQAVGDTTGATETGAKKEVIADWVGKNLWKNNFAAIVAAKDKGLANKLALTMWNIRRGLSFTENGRQTARVKYAEQLLMKAIEDTARTDPALELNTPSDPSGGEYAFIGKLKDGTRVYESENKTISVDDAKEEFKNRIATIFNLGAVELKTDTKKLLVRGDKFTVNKNVYGDDYATEAEMEAKYRMLYDMADVLSTATYMPSKTQPEPSYINPSETPKNAAHKDVKYWYKFKNDIVLNEVGYTVTFNIRDKGKEQFQYLIDVKENGHPVSHTAIEGLRRAYRVSTNTRLSQNNPRVNTQSMQKGENNSSSGQLSFLPPEMAESGKPDVYQEDGEREVYLAEGNDTSSVTADAVPPFLAAARSTRGSDRPPDGHSLPRDAASLPQGEGYDGAIDENVPRLSFTADFEADVIRRFGITKMNDYIHVQKQVKEALPGSFFAPVQNWRSGMVVNITRKGINETFNKDTFEKIPHSLQIAKLATVELIPEAIANGTYVKEVPNYHNADSSVRYAYIYYDTELQGQPCQLKIDVRMSLKSKSNRLHVHSVVLTNENIGGRAEVDIQENDARPNLPPISQTVYSGGEDLSSASQNDEYELVNQEVFCAFLFLKIE